MTKSKQKCRRGKIREVRELNKRQVGNEYEAIAAEYLKKKGYRILEKNYYTPFGELDIIADKDGILCYIEIKYRSSKKYGNPLEAVDFRKQRRISKSAMYHYMTHGAKQKKACRFDVIGINAEHQITHVENAFPYCE